jgi:hypothetical protein
VDFEYTSEEISLNTSLSSIYILGYVYNYVPAIESSFSQIGDTVSNIEQTHFLSFNNTLYRCFTDNNNYQGTIQRFVGDTWETLEDEINYGVSPM